MSSAMDRCLHIAASGPVQAPINDYAWARALHRGWIEVVGYRPGRLRQTFTITPRGRARLQQADA